MILIIDKDRKNRNAIAEIFYYMGVISYPASPTESVGEISPNYRAVLISSPENIPSLQLFIERLKKFCKNVPFFALSDSDDFDKGLFEFCFKNNIYSSNLVITIANCCKNKGIDFPGKYMLAGIDACADRSDVRYLDRLVPITKTETMILRYLFATYPQPKKAQSILKYAFHATKKPEVSNVRTHISIMNKKFLKRFGRILIVNIEGRGYVVATPEILEEFKI